MPGRYHVSTTEGVVYGRADGAADGRELRLDVHRPDDVDGPLPALVLYHGGSWRTGDRTQLGPYGILVGREGYVCVTPEYRLLDEAPWPAQLDDARSAFRWVHAHAAELGVDPDRIGVHGHSAGAHLALLLAADGSLPTKVCTAVYPPVLLQHGDELEPGATPLWALEANGDLELERVASPLRQVGAHFPPTKLIHGTTDAVVPVEASLRMWQDLHAAGVPVDLHIYADQPHAFVVDPRFARQNAAEILLFLDRYL